MNTEGRSFGIQVPDDRGATATSIRFVTFRDACFASGDFVIISCPVTRRDYFGEVSRPQLNMNRDGLAPIDVTTINQLERLHLGQFDRSVVVKEFHLYDASLLRDVTGGAVSSVRRRPQIGALIRKATDVEVLRYLGLPAGEVAHQIGVLVDSSVPVSIDERILRHHLMVAGATGSGKSNVLASIIDAAACMGFHVIIYDHKPDYQDVDQPNDEWGEAEAVRGLPDTRHWGLSDDARRRADERPISVPSSQLDPAILAHTICHKPQELNSAELLESLLFKFAEERNGSRWSLADFTASLPSSADQAGQKFGIEVHKATYSAMKGRLERRGRIPVWVDGRGSRAEAGLFGGRGPETFSVPRTARAGGVDIIRIPNSESSGRSYGLFLSYILAEVYGMRESDPASPPVLHVIDEAQDIFNAGRNFRDAFGDMLNRNIRKGRTRRIGFVISVQSAESVPEDTRQNLNSVIIHRHNNYAQVREALNMATPDQIALTATFGPGEALAYLFGSAGVVHCRMNRSPFRLTKE